MVNTMNIKLRKLIARSCAHLTSFLNNWSTKKRSIWLIQLMLISLSLFLVWAHRFVTFSFLQKVSTVFECLDQLFSKVEKWTRLVQFVLVSMIQKIQWTWLINYHRITSYWMLTENNGKCTAISINLIAFVLSTVWLKLFTSLHQRHHSDLWWERSFQPDLINRLLLIQRTMFTLIYEVMEIWAR